MMSHEFYVPVVQVGRKEMSIKVQMKAVKAEDDEKGILLSHENPLISHDRLK
jgi:hypothetical protein